ncbi:uncharacterized protein LOC143041437 [Oratosquilla oratoria]|uniref:uncharacterized protein LOC143041437 n=1 Tax=Oratosquilla oratoria TaxID=337810 RepID=UPI003F76F14F
MSCAQVMYQPYATNPYSASVQHQQQQHQQHHHHPQHHQHHHHQQQQQQQATDLVVGGHHARVVGGEARVGGVPHQDTPHHHPHPHSEPAPHHHPQQPQTQTQTQADPQPVTPHTSQDQPVGGAVASSGGTGSSSTHHRFHGRSASVGSPSIDPDAPPEKKFCSEVDAPQAPATPSHLHHHQQQQQQQQQQQREPSGTPPAETNDVKYVSANCVLVTHYQGDVASVVDEHFTRALSSQHFDKPHSPGKAASPMSSRNFPPSFWNSNYQPSIASSSSSSSSRPPSLAGPHFPSHHAAVTAADLYDPYHGGLHSLQHPAADPWHYPLTTQAYGHRGVAHDMYQAAMSSMPSSSRAYPQYTGLPFQPSLAARLPGVGGVSSQMSMTKVAADGWGARYHESLATPTDLSHGLEANYSPAAAAAAAHYANVPTEAWGGYVG